MDIDDGEVEITGVQGDEVRLAHAPSTIAVHLASHARLLGP